MNLPVVTSIKMDQGKLVLTITGDQAGVGSLALNVSVELIHILEKMVASTPQTWDDKALALLKLIAMQAGVLK